MGIGGSNHGLPGCVVTWIFTVELRKGSRLTRHCAAVAAGAQMTGGVVVEPTNRFQVMLDPEGNEFCFIDRAVGNSD